MVAVRRSLCEKEEEEEEEEGVERCLVQFYSRVIIYSNLDIILQSQARSGHWVIGTQHRCWTNLPVFSWKNVG